jgi:two-component system, cell cycle response regulator
MRMSSDRGAGGARLPGIADLRGRKILVVDDDRANLRFVKEGLGEDYAFIEASDGEQALALVRDHLPDLVICDVEMPRMGGFEVVRILKNNRRFSFIPIILMTAREESERKLEGLELGADDYLIKPVNLLELGARVRSMLRLKVLQDELLSTNSRLQEINEKLHELSMTDALTGIFNRLYFTKRFAYEFQRASRYHVKLTCIMMDIDYFKKVNDTYGHQMGDAVLKGVAKTLQAGLRKVDLLARYGGEEIVVVLPETDFERGMQVAERLRESVAETEYTDDRETIRVTCSMGVSALPHEGVKDCDDLLRLADEALYEAKEGGRNRVVAAKAS